MPREQFRVTPLKEPSNVPINPMIHFSGPDSKVTTESLAVGQREKVNQYRFEANARQIGYGVKNCRYNLRHC